MVTRGLVRAAIASGVGMFALALTAAPAQAVEREVEFQNDCPHPVRVLVAHAYAEDSWDAHGWYEFSANEEATQLEDNDEPLLQLDDHALFIYAESTDDSELYWDGEEHYETFGEVTYGMKRAVLEVVRGDLRVRLTCEGS
jgi:hypothetical protein